LRPLLADADVALLSREDRPTGDTLHITGDLRLPGPWQEAVRSFRPQWCFHLAWDGLPDYSLERCRINLDANVALFSTLAEAGVERVVVTGTCWEYGQVSGARSEGMAPHAVNLFAATKLAVHAMLDGIARQAGFEYRWARVFFAYGPGQRDTSLIPHLRSSLRTGTPLALRQPGAVQDFIHARDVARGLVALANADGPSGAFNLGSGTPASVAEIANRVASYYGQPNVFDTVVHGDGFWADMSQTRERTGWRPEIALDDGIAETLRSMDAAA
jgi:nucleoside-diphosphate-sugar epimerase